MKKKNLLSILITSIAIFTCSSIFAQTATKWSDVIKEERGDVVVVKGYESCSFLNTLLTAVKGDTTATGERTNPNRIYETIPGETYISDVTLELDITVPVLRIVAPKPADGVKPPLHIRANKADGLFDKTFFQTPGSVYMQNQYFCHATINETFDREFIRCQGRGGRFEYDNCIFELTNWTMQLPMVNKLTFKFTNCKFINVGHEGTLEKGVVLETRTLPPDTIWAENCTFLNGGALFLSLENSAPTFVYFNHNTIVNCSQPPLCFSTAAEMVVENNLFVNTGFVPDYPGFYTLFDDDDLLPKGLINADTVETVWKSTWWPDSIAPYPYEEKNRKILFDRNSSWNDPRFADMVNTKMKPIHDSIGQKWQSQMIVMNSRTKAMFDDNKGYPYFSEGKTLNLQPDFVNNKDVVNEWIDYVVTNATPGKPNGGSFIPWWRTNLTTEVYNIDWPLLANLTYSDATLKGAGYNGFPLGDLNWFPAEKEKWSATKESKILLEALKSGKIPEVAGEIETTNAVAEVNSDLQMLSVSPNPLINTANVKYSLSRAAKVELVIYNLLGEKIRVMELGYRATGNHDVTVSKGDLKPGMYILKINTDNNKAGLTTKISVK